MGSFGDYWEKKVLDHIFNKAAYTAPTIYVALSTADPTDTGSGLAEPSGNGYARKATAPADWNAAAGTNPTVTDNANALTFNEASGSWGTITHFALMDAASAGNLLAYGALTTPKAISAGDTPQFAVGDLDVQLD
jgi:hypothetical protein